MRLGAVTYFKNADKVYRGLAALDGALGLTRVTKDNYEPVLIEAKAKAAAFNRGRASKTAAFTALREKRPAVKKFLGDVRNLLSAVLGAKYTPVWLPLGFNGSLELPRTDAGRCQMLAKIKAYFENNPQREVAGDGFSALAAEGLCNSYTQAVNLVDDCKHDTRTKGDARKVALQALDKKLGDLRRELGMVLDPTDPRWLKFYDRIPGDPRPPEKVKGVSATVQPGGIIAVDWGETPRAAHYKVFKQVVGVDAELVLVKTVEESDAELTGLPSGATVKLQIVATNAEGAGAPSDVIELQAA